MFDYRCLLSSHHPFIPASSSWLARLSACQSFPLYYIFFLRTHCHLTPALFTLDRDFIVRRAQLTYVFLVAWYGSSDSLWRPAASGGPGSAGPHTLHFNQAAAARGAAPDRDLPPAVRVYQQLLASAEEDVEKYRANAESLREENDRLRAEINELRSAIPPAPSLTDGSSVGDDERSPSRLAALNTIRRATTTRLEARLRGRLAEYEALVATQSAQIRDLQEALNQAWLINQELVQARRATNN